MMGGSMLRLYTRVALVGFWGLLVGLVTVVGAAKALAASSTGGVDSSGLRGAGVSLTPLVAGVVGGLFDVGLASLGVGAIVMTVGTRYCISSARVQA